MRALYFASMELKAEADKKHEQERANKKRGKGRK